MQIRSATVESSMQLPQKKKKEKFIYHVSSCKTSLNTFRRAQRYLDTLCIATAFTLDRLVSINKRLGNENIVYIHSGLLFTHKKNEIVKQSEPDTERQILYDFSYV